MTILDGKQVAEKMLARLRALPVPKKYFAGVLVGDDPASASFQKLKQSVAEGLGIDYRIYHLDASRSKDDLREEVGKIAAHGTCGGVIVQLPIPGHDDKQYILNAIPIEKDPDVLSERALGAFYAGRGKAMHPAAGAVDEILKFAGYDLAGKIAAVVGPGFLIGRPVATWLMGKATEVRTLDRGANLKGLRDADLVVTGVGKIGLVTEEMLKPGACVIDFGYAKGEDGKLHGDFELKESDPPSSLGDYGRASKRQATGFYTPTPGGTGPALVAKLFENFYALTA